MADAPLPGSPSAEQIMGMPAEVSRRWTAREVRDLIAAAPLATPRYELVDGELLVTPSPALPHQMAVSRLLIALTTYLDRERVGAVIPSPSDVELEPQFVTQPDIFAVPRNEWRRVMAEGLPIRQLLLAVEVLSPGTARADRRVKLRLYQRQRVPEYWIVDVDARLIERWRPEDQRPEILAEQLEWQPSAPHPPLVIDLAAYFRDVTGA